MNVRRVWTEWPDRYEFEFAWAGLSIILGIGYLFAVPATAVRNLMPAWVVVAWALALFLGGLSQVIGMQTYLRRPSVGLITERAGLVAQSAALVILIGAAWWSWSQPTSERPVPFLASALILVWLVVNVRRDRQIASEFKRRTKSTDELLSGLHGGE